MPTRELPHPLGWTFLGQSTEERPASIIIDGSPLTMIFTFNQYSRTDADGRLHLMAIQVFDQQEEAPTDGGRHEDPMD